MYLENVYFVPSLFNVSLLVHYFIFHFLKYNEEEIYSIKDITHFAYINQETNEKNYKLGLKDRFNYLSLVIFKFHSMFSFCSLIFLFSEE
jgi:hypothetical protein